MFSHRVTWWLQCLNYVVRITQPIKWLAAVLKSMVRLLAEEGPYLHVTAFISTLWPTHHPIPGILRLGIKRPEREVKHSSLCNVDVSNAWSSFSFHSVRFNGVVHRHGGNIALLYCLDSYGCLPYYEAVFLPPFLCGLLSFYWVAETLGSCVRILLRERMGVNKCKAL